MASISVPGQAAQTLPGDPDDAALARSLIENAASAALGTLGSQGEPFVSFVTTATSANGSPVLLLSRLAWHSRNLEADARASLLLVGETAETSETMNAVRITLLGKVLKDDDPESATRFLARHPEAAGYARFGDFGIHRFHIETGHLVAGFGRIVTLPWPTSADSTAPNRRAR